LTKWLSFCSSTASVERAACPQGEDSLFFFRPKSKIFLCPGAEAVASKFLRLLSNLFWYPLFFFSFHYHKNNAAVNTMVVDKEAK